jgi:hypothetical protein
MLRTIPISKRKEITAGLKKTAYRGASKFELFNRTVNQSKGQDCWGIINTKLYSEIVKGDLGTHARIISKVS